MPAIEVNRHGRVVVVRLNRPKSLNALNSDVVHELVHQLKPLDQDANTGCFVITGSEKVFAAGADIKEMSKKSYLDMLREDYFAAWDDFSSLRTPKIAAVSGYALGGGCELAMMCDIIYAASNAQFGQPELTLGVMPGMGGSQRLTKLIGKVKAMDMILTGRTLDALEAERCGLVARVVEPDQLLEEALTAAETIASFSKTSVLMAREAVERAMEVGLQEGLLFERRVFHALFATADQKVGMQAFINKETPQFTGE